MCPYHSQHVQDFMIVEHSSTVVSCHSTLAIVRVLMQIAPARENCHRTQKGKGAERRVDRTRGNRGWEGADHDQQQQHQRYTIPFPILISASWVHSELHKQCICCGSEWICVGGGGLTLQENLPVGDPWGQKLPFGMQYVPCWPNSISAGGVR